MVTSDDSHMPSAAQQLRSSRPGSNDLKEPPIRLRRWATGLDAGHWQPTLLAVTLRPSFAGLHLVFFCWLRLWAAGARIAHACSAVHSGIESHKVLSAFSALSGLRSLLCLF